MFLDFNLVRTLMRDNLKKSLNKKKKKEPEAKYSLHYYLWIWKAGKIKRRTLHMISD